MRESHLLMVGLPEAGKTTFLAALWYLGTSGSKQTSFTVKHLDGDLTYLNSIARAWLQCTPLPRTKVRESNIAELVVTDVASTEIAHLVIPDLSGEIFQDSIANRRWDARAAQSAEHANGLLLFINPAHVIQPDWIFQAPETQRRQSFVSKSWTPIDSPTEVLLVDLLQTVSSLRNGASLRCSVVVSAWDLEAESYSGPGEWIAENVPLLDQFLTTSADRFPSKSFGVSAQGGELPDHETKLLELDPQTRVRIIEGPERAFGRALADISRGPHDLAAPIRWLAN